MGNSIANMMYTWLQNYIDMVVGKHKIQIFEVVIVVLLFLLLSFDIFVLTSAHPIIFNFFWTSGLSKYTWMLVYCVCVL